MIIKYVSNNIQKVSNRPQLFLSQ